MRLKILTLNLLYSEAVNSAGEWRLRRPLALDVMRSGFDVVGLQEVTLEQLDDLRRELHDFEVVSGPDSGESHAPGVIRSALAVAARSRTRRRNSAERNIHEPVGKSHIRGEHCAILFQRNRFELIQQSAFWLSDRPEVGGTRLAGTWLPRVVNHVTLKCTQSGSRLSVYNAHLDFMPWAPPRSARIIREAMDGEWDGSLQILLGDFNAGRYSAAYRVLQRAGKAEPLIDAWQAAERREGPEGTYHAGSGRVRWPGRLDRILFRPTCTVERAQTITHHLGPVFPSDHFPVAVEMRIC